VQFFLHARVRNDELAVIEHIVADQSMEELGD
jgi:hypothetical protein